MEWQDRVAIVTGASSGIGQATAIELSRRRVRVAAVARRENKLRQVLQEVQQSSPESLMVLCDVQDQQQVRDMVATVVNRYGTVDILINNAGMGAYRSFADSPVEEIEKIMRINYLGAVYCTKEVLPILQAKKSGWIVNVSSIAGKIATLNNTAYCASKFALLGFSESLYYELKSEGIHVAVICPGYVEGTEFHHGFVGAPAPPAGAKTDTRAVARAIVDAVEKGRCEVTIPSLLGWASVPKALAPDLFRWGVGKFT